MNLLVPIKYDYRFTLKVCKKLKRDVYREFLLYQIKLIKLNTELNKIFNTEDNPLLIKDIIEEVIDNVVIINIGKYYSIEVDRIKNYPNTRIKLIDLLKFITYGNLNVKGIPIWVDEINKLSNKLNKLYHIYKYRGIVI